MDEPTKKTSWRDKLNGLKETAGNKWVDFKETAGDKLQEAGCAADTKLKNVSESVGTTLQNVSETAGARTKEWTEATEAKWQEYNADASAKLQNFRAYRSNCRIFLSRSISIGQIAGCEIRIDALPIRMVLSTFAMQSEAQWSSAGVQLHEE